MDDDLRDLWDDADDAVEAARRTLNRFDQTLFACSEEAAEAGADLLELLAGLGDLWDQYRQAHEALAVIVNDIYREYLA